MAQADREQEIPRGLAAALLVVCAIAAVAAVVYLLLLSRSPEPLHVKLRDPAGPPIQQQLNIDALVQERRAFIPALKAPQPAPTAQTPRRVIPEPEYRQRDPHINRLLAELPVLLPEKFEARTHRFADGRTMPYRLFRPPGYTSGRVYPLVFYLHGSLSRGADNLSNLQHSATLGAGVWTLAENQLKEPCFVLVPQCPPEPARWTDNGAWNAPSHQPSAEPTDALRLAVEILGAVEQEFRIDRARVYLAGTSMGAFGVFDLASRYPERFAALIAVSGGIADGQASAIAKVPAWIFHGDRDEVVPPRRSVRAFEQLLSAGGKVRLSEYQNAGHDAWKYAFTEPGLADWLFAQRR